MKSSRRVQRQIEIVIRYGMAHEIPHLEIPVGRTIDQDLASLKLRPEIRLVQRTA